MSFTVYPAIDLLGGHAVRLTRGLRESAEVVGEPLALAHRFAAAPLLHVVDLDGAFAGQVRQLELIARLAAIHPLQAGGGVRSLDDVREPAPRPARASLPATAGDDPEVSWQRLLSFADRVNTSRGRA